MQTAIEIETQNRLGLPREGLVQFCRRWAFARLGLFGSVLREDFRPDSDVDGVVSFLPAG